MGSPLDAMILRSVKCLQCGAGWGACDCAKNYARRRAEDREQYIDSEYQRLMALSDEDLLAECEKLGVKTER